MRSLPADLAPSLLRSALDSGWGLGSGSMDYRPEGGGAYHWTLTGRSGQGGRQVHFVTVDDLDTKDWFGSTRAAAFAGLGQALGTAAALRFEAGLEFVVAPIPAEDGHPLRRLDDRYSVSVFPFLPGRSFAFGPYPGRRLRTAAVELVATLHQATPVVIGRAPVHAPGFAGRADLMAFLAEPDRPWTGGPFGEDARRLLAGAGAGARAGTGTRAGAGAGARAGAGAGHTSGLARLVDAFDQLVVRSAASRANPVITHGEPHPANLRSSGGQLYLVDWDTAALGPPERDLSLIAADSGDLDRYRRLTGRDLDPAVIKLYRLRWYLDDLGSAVKMFSGPHQDTADTRRWRAALASLLERLPEWIERADAGA